MDMSIQGDVLVSDLFLATGVYVTVYKKVQSF
jgi:hypothetical protein